MSFNLVIPVTDRSHVGEARRAAARLADAAALDETARGGAAIVVTELANNLARYGQNGRLLLRSDGAEAGPAIEMTAVDAGPGMTDVAKCLQDGFSTGGTPGTGLGAIRRLSSAFDIHSVPGSGTVVFARIGATAPPPPGTSAARAGRFEWAAVSVPAPHEEVCGDAWRVATAGDQIAILIADGLGHGPLAAEASTEAAQAFDERPFDAPAAVIESAHRAASGTRGAAVAVACGSAAARTLRYAGIGNIAGVLQAAGPGDRRGLFSNNGIVGHQMHKVRELDYPWPDRGLLVMHSDGIQTRWGLDAYPGLTTRHPAVIAAVLFRDFLRGRDDATIVVARLTGGPRP